MCGTRLSPYPLSVCVYRPPGDDPNYWMALTQQADAEYVSKKVRKMLAEVNKPGSNPVSECQPAGGGVHSLSCPLDSSRCAGLRPVVANPAPAFPPCLQASGPGNGGPGHPPMPTLSTSPQATERDVSASAAKQGWLGSVLKQAVQRMSRTNLFTRSSDSYRPYASELSPRPSGGGGSNDGFERMTRNTYLNWSTTEPRRHGITAAAAAAAAAAAGGRPQAVVASAAGACEHLESSSLPNSRDSSEGWAPGTAGGSESSASAPASAAGGGAGGGTSLGGGKRWSSGSSGSNTAAPHASEGGVTIATSTTGSSRGGSDAASAGGSGGGAAGALDSISRKLRLSSSKSGRQGEAAQQPEQPVPAGGTPPTYATISELHSVTAQADGSGGGISSGFWPSVPKHMRTITEDSLEYRLDASLGASRPSSRGGHAGPAGARNSSSGADVSPNSASTPGTSALSASLATQAAAVAVAAGGGSSMDSSSSSTPHAQNAGGAGAAACSPSPLSRTSSAVPPSPLGGGFGAAAAAPPAGGVLEDGRGASLAASMAAMQHLASREGSTAPRASVASLDSIDERSSVGTCIIHSSLPSSPGMGEGSLSNVSSRSGTPGLPETPPDSAATGRDISFAGDALMGFGGAGAGGGITLQGAFAAAAMPSSSGGNSGRNSCSNLGGGLEASLRPVNQGDVHISFLPTAAAAAGTHSAPGSSGGSRHHSVCESVDFSKAQLQDLSRADTPAGMEADASNPGSLGMTRRRTTGDAESGGGSARWSPFAASDHIAGSIAAAGVAGWHELVGAGGGQEPEARSRSFSTQQQQGTSSRQQQQPAAGNAVQQQRRQSAQDGDSSRGGSFSQRRQQQQQAGSGNGSSSQHGLGRSCHGSSNGSSSASGSSKLQRQRVQQPSRHSSSEPSPSSQTCNLPPGWSAGWQHQQGAQGQGPQLRCSSSTTSRALSPVGGAFVPSQAQAVAGAAVGAGQELTPAALAAASGGPGSLADAAADRLQRMLDCEPDAFWGPDAAHGPFGGERRVAYHWWKELPADTLRKCDSLGSEQQAWQEYGDRPLLAKPSVRFRKTINTHKIGPDGREYAIAVNAQHYAVLVTDVQPC